MSDPNPSDKITFSLIENALDFLQSAVSFVKTRGEHDRCVKYGLLHLCDGIELLLKYRLHEEHWSLVVANLDKTTPAKIETGDFESVGWKDAITRVEKCTGQPFSKIDTTLLEHLRKMRNRIQHFDVDVSRNEAHSILAQGLHFATGFIEAYLADDDLAEELVEIRKELAEFNEFVSLRLAAIEAELSEATITAWPLPCPRCRQEALFANDLHSKCLFCGHTGHGEAVAQEWVEEFGGSRSLKDEAVDPSVLPCPMCNADALVAVPQFLDYGHYPDYCCFCCGAQGEYQTCDLCGRLFHPDECETACHDCLVDMANKD